MALVPIVGMLLIKESVSIIALIGVVVVFFGIFTLGNITHMKSVNSSDLFLSLITGITVTSYTIVDKYAVSLINPFFVFSISSFLGGFLSITLIDKRIIFTISFFSAVAYTLVLYAYKYSEVSLVTPLREVQTAIAAIMGIVLLKEELKLYKIIGVSLIVVGAVLITY